MSFFLVLFDSFTEDPWRDRRSGFQSHNDMDFLCPLLSSATLKSLQYHQLRIGSLMILRVAISSFCWRPGVTRLNLENIVSRNREYHSVLYIFPLRRIVQILWCYCGTDWDPNTITTIRVYELKPKRLYCTSWLVITILHGNSRQDRYFETITTAPSPRLGSYAMAVFHAIGRPNIYIFVVEVGTKAICLIGRVLEYQPAINAFGKWKYYAVAHNLNALAHPTFEKAKQLFGKRAWYSVCEMMCTHDGSCNRTSDCTCCKPTIQVGKDHHEQDFHIDYLEYL